MSWLRVDYDINAFQRKTIYFCINNVTIASDAALSSQFLFLKKYMQHTQISESNRVNFVSIIPKKKEGRTELVLYTLIKILLSPFLICA